MNLEVREVSTARPLRLIKPRGFKAARQVRRAEFLINGPQGFGNQSPKGRTASQKRGKRYERKVLEILETLNCFKLFTPNPWIEFDDSRSAGRLCQPDALAFGDDWLLILEIKLSHTIMAYWQLRELYAPVLSMMYPDRQIRVCEVTRSFDPATPWPENIRLLHSTDSLLALRAQDFGVLQWRI